MQITEPGSESEASQQTGEPLDSKSLSDRRSSDVSSRIVSRPVNCPEEYSASGKYKRYWYFLLRKNFWCKPKKENTLSRLLKPLTEYTARREICILDMSKHLYLNFAS